MYLYGSEEGLVNATASRTGTRQQFAQFLNTHPTFAQEYRVTMVNEGYPSTPSRDINYNVFLPWDHFESDHKVGFPITEGQARQYLSQYPIPSWIDRHHSAYSGWELCTDTWPIDSIEKASSSGGEGEGEGEGEAEDHHDGEGKGEGEDEDDDDDEDDDEEDDDNEEEDDDDDQPVRVTDRTKRYLRRLHLSSTPGGEEFTPSSNVGEGSRNQSGVVQEGTNDCPIVLDEDEDGKYRYYMSKKDMDAIQHSYAMAEFTLKLDEGVSANELKEFQKTARDIKPILHRMGSALLKEAPKVNTPGAVVERAFGPSASKRARLSNVPSDSSTSYTPRPGPSAQTDTSENSLARIIRNPTNNMNGSGSASRVGSIDDPSANWKDEPTAGAPVNIIKDYYMQLAESNHKTYVATKICWDMSMGESEFNSPATPSFHTNLHGVRPEKMIVVHDMTKHAFVIKRKTARYLESMLEDLKNKFGRRENVQCWSLAFFCNNIAGLHTERTLFSATSINGAPRFNYQAMFGNWHTRKASILSNEYIITIRKRLLAIAKYIALHNSVVKAFYLTPADHRKMIDALPWDKYVEVFGEREYDDSAGARDERNRTPDFKVEEAVH